MKGVIFNVVEEVLAESFPLTTWDEALVDSGVEGAYTSLGDYPDDEMQSIVAAVATRLGLEPGEVLRTAGREGYRILADRHPHLVRGFPTFGELIRHLDDVIHPEVLKLYPHAEPPQFSFVQPGRSDDADRTAGGGHWTVVYRSRRGLCDLASGLLQGAAQSYGLDAAVEHTECVHRGGSACVFDVRTHVVAATDGGAG